MTKNEEVRKQKAKGPILLRRGACCPNRNSRFGVRPVSVRCRPAVENHLPCLRHASRQCAISRDGSGSGALGNTPRGYGGQGDCKLLMGHCSLQIEDVGEAGELLNYRPKFDLFFRRGRGGNDVDDVEDDCDVNNIPKAEQKEPNKHICAKKGVTIYESKKSGSGFFVTGGRGCDHHKTQGCTSAETTAEAI